MTELIPMLMIYAGALAGMNYVYVAARAGTRDEREGNICAALFFAAIVFLGCIFRG